MAHKSKRNRTSAPGVVLVFAAGILAILAALGMAFFTVCQSATMSSVRYSDMVRAELLTQAGLQYSVAKLREKIYSSTEAASDAWYTADYLRGATKRVSFPESPLLHNNVDDDGDGVVDNAEEAISDPTKMASYAAALGSSIVENGDRFTLNVEDSAGKINVNAGDNLAVLLDNLCRVIGPPLVAANLDALQPRRWAVEADPTDEIVIQHLYDTALNDNDTVSGMDIYYTMTNEAGAVTPGHTGRPIRGTDNQAIYGDGYAMAAHRARYGAFQSLDDVKKALTYVERNGTSTPDDPLERMEIETKFVALRDHITISSWVDTNTVCTGKFEWVHLDTATGKTYAMDRDKSWVIDDPVNDPLNERGSLRGCYLSIMNGHGAGQLRRIRTNGIDWIEVEGGFAVTPGPISSYMIISNEEAQLTDEKGNDLPYSYPDNPPPAGTLAFPKINTSNGTLIGNPKMNYAQHPLCIHRAPVNVNTATDKVLAALFLGINVQHGHPLSLGTDADVEQVREKWTTTDPHKVNPYLLTANGLKRIPAASGKVIQNRSWGTGANQVAPPSFVPTKHPEKPYDVSYLNNSDSQRASDYGTATGLGAPGTMTEAHELAYRIIMARQIDPLEPDFKYIDPATGGPVSAATGTTFERGPFRNYDDLYFKVIKPWDEKRFKDGWVDKNGNSPVMDDPDEYHKARLSNMIMANANSNTDILKFNPNIEWIDRWSRNFSEMEPVMVYTNVNYVVGVNAKTLPDGFPVFTKDVGATDYITAASKPLYTAVRDTAAVHGLGTYPSIKSSQRNAAGALIEGAYITRSFRYKSDEMIDKTDMNRSTTEFSFDSNGLFEIVSTGQVIAHFNLAAERKAYTLVKVYDVWRESTQQQFVMGTISKAYGARGSTCSGQVTRDASGLVERKGLVTLPEPLLPLKAKIVDHNGNTPGNRNFEAVSFVGTNSREPLDAFGNTRMNPFDKGEASYNVPDVLANRVLPARYDGQIVLSTNTSGYDTTNDKDCFLASFDGDLDTATCEGNGREQAKWPYSAEPDPNNPGNFRYTKHGYKHRCVDSIGLLGLLNDALVVSDPGLPLIDGTTPFNDWATDAAKVRLVYPFRGISTTLTPLKLGTDLERPAYWNNIILRMGALRTDGAYLGAPGVSGNAATIKYLYSPSNANRRQKLNFQPDSVDGNCISMWAKTTWHHDDMRNHEFFNPNSEGYTLECRAYYFQKMGQYTWKMKEEHTSYGSCANRKELNDLGGIMFYGDRWGGHSNYIHGGYAGEAEDGESPGYRVQPFRWSFLGYRAHYSTKASCPTPFAPVGHLVKSTATGDYSNTAHIAINKYYFRPFIDTALYPEIASSWTGDNMGYRLRWGYRGYDKWGKTLTNTNTYGDARDVTDTYAGVTATTSIANPNVKLYSPVSGKGVTGEGQDVKWVWAEPYGQIAPDPDMTSYSLKCFGINNLNFGNPVYNSAYNDPKGVAGLRWHYRNLPEDGTYAVIDELKISNKDRVLVDSNSPDWANDRIKREMQLSRYYLPPNPGTRAAPEAGGPPTFTSQTLFQSRRGFDTTCTESAPVAVVRVNWNVFTPRFMCEYTSPEISPHKRNELLKNFTAPVAAQQIVPDIKFKGPFDYVRYNDNSDTSDYSVNRPPPWAYPKEQAPMNAGDPDNRPEFLTQSGRGVEVELLQEKDPSYQMNPLLGGKTFTNPSARNALGTPLAPVFCPPDELRYRVRFCYPVDSLVDPTITTTNATGKCVDATKQYLLDTPVFDDISITFVGPLRILDYREVTE